ncbi:hypothetical protein ACFL2K_02515, partial [Candidatus Margulisiibacteriota bacterium]
SGKLQKNCIGKLFLLGKDIKMGPDGMKVKVKECDLKSLKKVVFEFDSQVIKLSNDKIVNLKKGTVIFKRKEMTWEIKFGGNIVKWVGDELKQEVKEDKELIKMQNLAKMLESEIQKLKEGEKSQKIEEELDKLSRYLWIKEDEDDISDNDKNMVNNLQNKYDALKDSYEKKKLKRKKVKEEIQELEVDGPREYSYDELLGKKDPKKKKKKKLSYWDLIKDE